MFSRKSFEEEPCYLMRHQSNGGFDVFFHENTQKNYVLTAEEHVFFAVACVSLPQLLALHCCFFPKKTSLFLSKWALHSWFFTLGHTKFWNLPYPWAQLGEWRVPPLFQTVGSGDIICHVPPHFLFRFLNILVSHQPVPHILQQNCAHDHI